MSGGVSYYGSKISLISNAGIRYEGHLFSVDTNESTVTLSKVRSFGTEERVCDHPVAQRDEMYDYIVFRGSDIKDLLVCEPPKQNTSIAQDPAILQHSGAVSTTQTPSFRPPNTFATAPAPFAPFNVPYQYGAMGGMMTNQFGTPQAQRPPQMGGDVNRQTPPLNRKSPTMEQAVQASGPHSPGKEKNEAKKKDDDKHGLRPEPQPQRRRGSREERRPNRDSRDTREEGRSKDGQDGRPKEVQQRDQDREVDRRRSDRPRDQGRRGPQGQQQPYRRGRGRGRGPRSPKEPIKVGTDFDFDVANAQYDKEAIEDELESKLKIVNGDEKFSEHEGSGSETPTSETQDEKTFYEPEKSFFDSISCESTNPDSRTRPSRREEYKMNTETFGVPFARGRGRGRGGYYRGGYRGGYNYQGNYNRSGYNTGYRGRGNYRGTAWNNRRNRNQDWGRGDGFQRRERDDNRRRDEGNSSQNKGSSDTSQKEGIKVAEGS